MGYQKPILILLKKIYFSLISFNITLLNLILIVLSDWVSAKLTTAKSLLFKYRWNYMNSFSKDMESSKNTRYHRIKVKAYLLFLPSLIHCECRREVHKKFINSKEPINNIEWDLYSLLELNMSPSAICPSLALYLILRFLIF